MMLPKLINWRHCHHCNHSARVFRYISRKLELDEQQQTKFENVQIVWNKARATLQQIRKERDEMLESVITAATINQDEVLRMVKIPLLSFNDEVPRVIEVYSDFHSSLNQDQREQLLGLWQKYRHYRPLLQH